MDQTMWELILDQGTVMLDATVVRSCSLLTDPNYRLEGKRDVLCDDFGQPQSF